MQPESLEAAIARRRRQRAYRRRRLYIRRCLLLLTAAAVLAVAIATPILIVRGVRRRSKAQDAIADTTPTTTRPSVSQTPQAAFPVVDGDTAMLADGVTSQYAVLLDMTDGRVVAAKNANTLANPASITKVMTLLVAVENIEDLQDTYTMSYTIIDPVYTQGASVTGLSSGEEVTLESLLYGCILPSGADATAALADYVAGGEAAFAEMMNQKALELGAQNTHFTNSSGLHDYYHKTTAMDMALIMAAAMKDPVCRKVLMAKEYLIPPTPQHPDGLLQTSTMFSHIGSRDTCILAGKTGYTAQAMNTLATYARIGGHEYVFVSMYANGSDKALEDAHTVYREYCHWE